MGRTGWRGARRWAVCAAQVLLASWHAGCGDTEEPSPTSSDVGVDAGVPGEAPLGAMCTGSARCASGFCAASDQCAPTGTVVPAGYRYIPGGTFTIGSPTDELGRDASENQTSRTVSSFFLKATEVTQGEWSAAGYRSPSRFSSCGDTCPVEQVNWWESLHFANIRSTEESLAACYVLTDCNGSAVGNGRECAGVTLEGGAMLPVSCAGYRLPTEAEWEYAYRAGTTTALYNGAFTHLDCSFDPVMDSIGWYCGNSDNSTRPVGGKAPNAWGLHDMSGNVWEWTWDGWDGSSPHAEVRSTDHAGSVSGPRRVVRGGGWNTNARNARAAHRGYVTTGNRNFNLGFRLARTAP